MVHLVDVHYSKCSSHSSVLVTWCPIAEVSIKTLWPVACSVAFTISGGGWSASGVAQLKWVSSSRSRKPLCPPIRRVQSNTVMSLELFLFFFLLRCLWGCYHVQCSKLIYNSNCFIIHDSWTLLYLFMYLYLFIYIMAPLTCFICLLVKSGITMCNRAQ